MYPVGGAFAAAATEHQQALVARVGDAVGCLGKKTGGTGDEKSDELGDGDAKVGEERRDDGLPASVLHGRKTSDECVGWPRSAHWVGRLGTYEHGLLPARE